MKAIQMAALAAALALGGCQTAGGWQQISTGVGYIEDGLTVANNIRTAYCPILIGIAGAFAGNVPASKAKAFNQSVAVANIACSASASISDPISLAFTIAAAIAAAKAAGLTTAPVPVPPKVTAAAVVVSAQK